MRGVVRCIAAALLALLAACGGGGGGDGGTPAGGCTGACGTTTASALSSADVQRIVSQAVLEAEARFARGTIAVVDRVGNVLAVFQMNGAPTTFTISSGRGVTGGLEGAVVAAEYGAISKALTGAYLSSEGNAFSTRTASQIVQENFNPGERNSPGGPLFGVQFSSLSCSDVVRTAAAGTAGPKAAPLGLAADPGGLPLYLDGTVVGGIGIVADGVYGLDLDVNDVDADLEELIAVAGARGYDAPADRRADRITADGRTLRYVDSEALASNPAAARPFAALAGSLVRVPGYFDPVAVRAGAAYATAASGVRADASAAFAGLGAYVLDDGTGTNRYPPVAGTDGLMTQAEVTAILAEAMKIANRARAQIRRPLGTAAEVSITVVDTRGAVLGLVRTRDAPVFGIDVAVQKARTAVLFSGASAGADLSAVSPSVASFVTAMRSFIPGGNALADGIAYSNRAVGNLSRPFFPDGINGNGPGPLSLPYASWSPFSVGLQLELVKDAVVANLGRAPVAPCAAGLPAGANGIQIFPGSVPIYRGNTLVGAIGVSGDGVDQDDMIAFLGVANAGLALNTGIANAPPARRADTVTLPGGQLRYVNCPIAPFLDTNASNVCSGL